MKRRIATLPLHGGKAPAWLFKRMARLSAAVTMAVVDEHGPLEMLRRLSDPWWFQAFGCALGFDWHSSGLTTVTCGALKEARRIVGDDLGIHVAGGKGKTSRKTPQEIEETADRKGIPSGDRLIHASRMSAKVDSAAVQDGYDIYHHSFFFTDDGAWCVVQQGMSEENKYARRYHWLGETVHDFVCEPHHGIDGEAIEDRRSREGQAHGEAPGAGEQLLLLNLVAEESGDNRSRCAELIRWNPDHLLAELERFTEGPTLFAPAHHPVLPTDVNLPRLRKIVRVAHENHPSDFATLLGTPGVGAATIRSLALLAELIYDSPASRRDPARTVPGTVLASPGGRERSERSVPGTVLAGRRWADYSYAHGGKDGFPYPVDRETYDRNIEVLMGAIRQARVGETDKIDALKRLGGLAGETRGGLP